MPDITAEHIARQIATNLHGDYDGFTVDETDVSAKRVTPGSVRVSGYNPDDPDSSVEFVVTVSQVEVD